MAKYERERMENVGINLLFTAERVTEVRSFLRLPTGVAVIGGFQHHQPLDSTAAPPQHVYLSSPEDFALALAYLCGAGCPWIVADMGGLVRNDGQISPYAVIGTAAALHTIADAVLRNADRAADLVVAGFDFKKEMKGTALAMRYEKGIPTVDEAIQRYLR